MLINDIFESKTEQGEIIPAGVYKVIIKSIEKVMNRDKRGSRLAITHKVVSGDHAGKMFTHYIAHRYVDKDTGELADNEIGRNIFRVMVSKILGNVANADFTTDDLCNKAHWIRISTEYNDYFDADINKCEAYLDGDTTS